MVKDIHYILLDNELVLIAPQDAKQEKVALDKQTDWSALLDDGCLEVCDPDHVLAGIYLNKRSVAELRPLACVGA